MATNSKKYVPDLQGFMLLCELNYARILKLLPELGPEGTFFDYCVRDTLSYRLTVVECCKYTTIINVTQIAPQLTDYLRPHMEVRLYHDASMAEVTRSQNVSRIKGSYEYPNKQMMQKDEKLQINRFLKDWLKLCLEHGQVSVDLSSY